MILKYVISANYRTILSFELYRDTQIRGVLLLHFSIYSRALVKYTERK